MASQKGSDRGFKRFGDLLEAQSADVTEVEDLLIRIRKTLQALEKQAIGNATPLLARGILAPPRQVNEGGGIRGNGLSASPPHLVTKSIHRYSEQPCLEPPAFLILGKLLNHGAEGGLDDLLGKLVIATLGSNHGEDPRRTSIDDVAPGRLVAGGSGGHQSNELIGIGVVHGSPEVYRWKGGLHQGHLEVTAQVGRPPASPQSSAGRLPTSAGGVE